jgi:hypothetical protein
MGVLLRLVETNVYSICETYRHGRDEIGEQYRQLVSARVDLGEGVEDRQRMAQRKP